MVLQMDDSNSKWTVGVSGFYETLFYETCVLSSMSPDLKWWLGLGLGFQAAQKIFSNNREIKDIII